MIYYIYIYEIIFQPLHEGICKQTRGRDVLTYAQGEMEICAIYIYSIYISM